MICPKCKRDQLSVIDSRRSDRSIRRRRKCAACGNRLSTVEIQTEEYEELRRIFNTQKGGGVLT